MLRLILAGCLAAAPLLAVGQTIYKVQMPDGSVLYTDSVPAGGKVLKEREAKSTPRVTSLPGKSTPAAAARTGVPDSTVIRQLEPAGKRVAPPPNVATSERELAVARRKLDLGREPLPGERRGLAGGGSRLTPEYESRIAGLEREVAAAEAKLRQAYEAR